MNTHSITTGRISWRWWLAILLFLFAFVGLSLGVSLTERPGVETASHLTKAYYSLGLFVVGGLDLGTPIGGPWYGIALLWIAYFGAPLLTASAVIDAVLTAMARRRWQLRRLRNHVVIVGSDDLTTSYLRVLRAKHPMTPVIVVDTNIDLVRELELAETFNVTVIKGDISHEFLLKELQLRRAARVILLDNNDFLSFEAASIILRLYPSLAGKIVIHCESLRFLRAMSGTRVSEQTVRFNSYNLAAKALVRDTLLDHFIKTEGKDTVVLAGFGLFGQTILEELQKNAPDHIARVIIVDLDAHRRIQVVQEQKNFTAIDEQHVLQGDISHPDVWRKIVDIEDLEQGEPVLMLGTGSAANNLRTALWIKEKYPDALVFSRTNGISEFAEQVGRDHDINTISITQLVEENISQDWLA